MKYVSSGDVTADKRFAYARDLAARGDDVAAADLYEQALALAPDFVTGWIALGECRERLGLRPAAVAAYRDAASRDPDGAYGAALHLGRLGETSLAAMSESYVRTLFDDYAPRFEHSLVDVLRYRGPSLLRDAVTDVCKEQGITMRFAYAVDVGCGTGLVGRAFADCVDDFIGIEIAPEMARRAEASGCYRNVFVGAAVGVLDTMPADRIDLVLAGDAVAYMADLAAFVRAAAHVLAPQGLLAFTAETHDHAGVLLGTGLRYAHGRVTVDDALAAACLRLCHIDHRSARNEAGQPVPGLVVVAQKARLA